ncbi:MAG TPA: DUF6436 domain-containing protein [Steroidobacteraceae bacterium]|nr:DUF6436 domain-containing protein [Steroidobacteraceae bacterium]
MFPRRDRLLLLVGDASHRRRILPWIVLSAWLSGMAIAFWYFEFQPQRSFAAPGFVAAADPQQREVARLWFQQVLSQSPTNTAAVTVVHVYRDGCDCNRFTDRHLAEIEARFRDSDVRFIRVRSGSAPAHGMPGWVESMPAAFVFGAGGTLLYFGPYSDAAWCGRSGALVEGVIERALQGVPPLPPATTRWGCFCESNGNRGVERST